jgi:hypothetical protein
MYCVESIRDKDLSQRMLSVADEIEAAETSYKQQAANAALYTIAEATTIANKVDVQEMKSLYDNTFRRKNSKTRHIYDTIIVSARFCPLCGFRDVSTLDHYLAKSKHPAFAVTPMNLVPCCAVCNKAKLDMQPSNAADQIFHPYFDDVEGEVWLVADLQETTPPVIVFSPAPSTTWDDMKQKRMLTHFRTFRLGSLYSTYAADELRSIHLSLTQIAERAGADGLRAYLKEQEESRRVNIKNSWQAAMYKVLGESDWFCDGGYNAISAVGASE